MAFEQNDNSGSLFKNDRKTESNHPDYTGTAKIGGVEFWMSAWLKEANSGKKFMSFSFKPKLLKDQVSKEPKKSLDHDLDDEIPF